MLLVQLGGKEREQGSFAIGLIIAALAYLGFAVIASASLSWLLIEVSGVGFYGTIALLGFRYSLWWLALGWLIHPLWDIGFHLLNPDKSFAPAWYAISCISFDLVVAVYIVIKVNEESLMNSANRAQKVLLALILLNIISTWFHYTDNALFVKQYPGPEWFTTAGIFATVMVMTPIGLFGYWLYTKEKFWLSYSALGLYSLTSISSPGHYLFPVVIPMSVKMHGLIWLDAVSGLLLIGFILWSMVVAQEWRIGSGKLPTL